jgi:hypothetical protein
MDDNKFVRDSYSGAVVNTDLEGLRQYKLRKQQTMRVEELRNEVNTLRDDMSEIKSLLQALVKTA